MSKNTIGTDMETLFVIVSAAGILILIGLFWWVYLPRIIIISDPYAETVADFRREISRWEHDS